ncbi:MAG: GerMN domain-containing protein [Patescibacteria group bacterium]
MAKKILFCSLVLSLGLVLGGCQNLGEQITQKQSPDETGQIQLVDDDSRDVDQTEQTVETPAVQPGSGTYKINRIFFGSAKHDPQKLYCNVVWWVDVQPSADNTTVDPLAKNLEVLLQGPTERWTKEGYYSLIPVGTKLNSVRLDGDTVYADFSGELNPAEDGCAANKIRSQIIETVKNTAREQLGKEVKSVFITVNGQDVKTLNQ